ncbi:MAG: sigma-70 family RNA polymerase sigma factor [Saprospiraceae bacterium]|nr:sigma-70 family RNA polymerase sigma factor [Saprospiraceae bacterium]
MKCLQTLNLVMFIPEEKQHLENLQIGDLVSFNWIFDKHYNSVYNFCLSFTKSAADAEELTTDVFVVIWNKRKSLDVDRPLKPLLFKVTKDLTWNFLRKIANRKSRQNQFLQNWSPHKSESTDAELLYQEYENRLLGLLEKLTPQQQRIFTLKYLKGKDLNQIAEELAISKNTVKTHLAKSKQFVLSQIPSLGAILLLLLSFG